MIDREALELECQLRLIELAETQDPEAKPIDLWIDAFWEGVRAGAKPRSLTLLQRLIDARRAAHNGSPHAKHRSRTATFSPARRDGEPTDPTLAAAVEAEAERARNRDRAGRQAAHEDSR